MPPKKASAPRPKVGGQQAAKDRKERAKERAVVTVGDTGVVIRFNLAAIPVRIRSLVRDQTGKSIEELIFQSGQFSVDSYCDLWWVTRLAAGEPVSRRHVQDEWDEKCAGITLDEISDPVMDADPEAPAQPS